MTTKTQSTIVAIFRNVADAQAASSDLRAEGFAARDIFISSDTSAVGSTDLPGSAVPAESHHEGGISGWFKSLFGEENKADQPYYETAVSSGDTFLSVDVTDQNIEQAVEILNEHSPVDVHRESGDTYVETAATDAAVQATQRAAVARPVTERPVTERPVAETAPAERSPRVPAPNDANTIPVVREDLEIGKRAVLRGGVRVYSRLVSEPVQENINLREERVRVERTAVDRPTTESDLRPGQERVFEVKEYAEEPVVTKQSRIVEEVRVSKDATNRTETVRDNLRHTEVNVENMGSQGSGRATEDTLDDSDFRRHFAATYGNTGYGYETYSPGYNYGYEMASDPRFQGSTFEAAEPQLRQDYARRYPNSAWAEMKDTVRYGWNKLTRKV